MELKEFVMAAITDITDAVSELQKNLRNGTIVNPTLSKSEPGERLMIDNEVREIERLNFDVAVTISGSSGMEAGIKAGITILGAKIGTASSERTENVSRLTFPIPIVLPSAHVKTPGETLREEHRNMLSLCRELEPIPRNDTSQAIRDGQDHSET